MELPEKYPDLPVILKGSSFSQLFHLFYILAQVRYATKDHLNTISNKLGTKKKLAHLVDTGYLRQNQAGAFFTAPKAIKALENEGYNTAHLQSKLTGETTNHELKTTSVILKLRPWRAFYPTFTEPPNYTREFLRPDACLVFKDDKQTQSRYKLQFLEVETKKGAWENYLLQKKDKYDKIAADFNTYDKWARFHFQKLGLKFPKIEDFCFSILCIAEVDFGWRGWEFTTI